MTPLPTQPARPSSLRSAIIAIALVPSVVFVSAALGIGWYLSDGALAERAQAELATRQVDTAGRFRDAVLDEREASVLGSTDLLGDARGRLDAALTDAGTLAAGAAAETPAPLRAALQRMLDTGDDVTRIRQQVDGGVIGIDAYRAFTAVVGVAASGLAGIGTDGSDADVDAAFAAADELTSAATAAEGAALVATLSGSTPLDRPGYREFVDTAGALPGRIGSAVAALPGTPRERVAGLLDTPEWRQSMADAAVTLAAGPASTSGDGPDRTPGSPDPGAPRAVPAGYPVTVGAVAAEAGDIASSTAGEAALRQAERADTSLTVIVAVVLAAVGLAVLAMFASFRLGTRLVRRLAGLREDTLRAAAQLPVVLDRIRKGEEFDVLAVIPDLDRGDDEIGRVAAAVTSAQQAAIHAAGQEARTRAGANAVFLNIAHRSQALVHRQLQLLDEAERAEHNSDQLARLFQLDHLTTRERRNAENLIIMGGEQPRRQWRRPVPLIDVVRGAVTESEQYTRITFGDMPEVHVEGTAVGDLIHLLAELVDNATAFSPPQCPIDVHAIAVGRGVVIEVRDRGLGIEDEPRARLNTMLANPPDFGLMTLSDDSRLGIFVVGRLAHRLGARVTLAESPYGGVQAIVLVPTAVLVDPSGAEDGASERPVPASDAVPVVDPADGAEPVASTGSPRVGRTATAANGAATPVAAEQADVPTPATAGRPADQPPPLPERRPQVHLAHELREQPESLDDTGEDMPIQRSRAAMSALQRASRDGRGAHDKRNGERP